MIVSLPMYDRPETRRANDRLFDLICAALPDTMPRPTALTRGTDLWADWSSPHLLLSQTCGLPFRTKLQGKVGLVGTPVHDLPCPQGQYYSVLIARRSDIRAEIAEFDRAPLALNDPLSQSGWAAPHALASQHGIAFQVAEITGSHAASLHAVAEGRADIAALDAVTWQMLQRYDPAAAAVRAVTKTEPTPALPYITAPDQDCDTLFTALKRAIAGLSAKDKATLCLKGVTQLPAKDYLAQSIPPSPT